MANLASFLIISVQLGKTGVNSKERLDPPLTFRVVTTICLSRGQ